MKPKEEEVTPVTAITADNETPQLFELTPNVDDSNIVDVEVTELPEGQTPSILTPSDDLETVSLS